MENPIQATVTTEVNLTPKQVAEVIWNMYDSEQAEILEHLHDIAGGDHNLMMQFLSVRDECSDKGRAAFQSMFASAYKWMWD